MSAVSASSSRLSMSVSLHPLQMSDDPTDLLLADVERLGHRLLHVALGDQLPDLVNVLPCELSHRVALVKTMATLAHLVVTVVPMRPLGEVLLVDAEWGIARVPDDIRAREFLPGGEVVGQPVSQPR